MAIENLRTAFAHIESEVSGPWSRLNARMEGDTLRFYTGTRYLQQSRWAIRTVGFLLIVASICLLWIHPYFVSLAAPGLLIFLFAPGYVRPTLLLEIDMERNLLTTVQPTVGPGNTVPLEQVRSIRGAYDTKGWDAFSTIQAVLEEETAVPILMFFGTDEPLAADACRLLGLLLDCPATYAGPFGHTTTCYTPS
ncbi:MAG TPA: hypothetical protein VKU00_03415 [Chthonomonadaceae bacterium]|nr:hypothetical protein [Chthonomonadaceae bacterium]